MNDSIYVVKPSLPPLSEYIDEIADMWDTGILTHTGPKHIKLQSELERYLNTKHISLFANGHLALELGLNSLELSGEVITTPFTFGSTTQAILRNGLKPVFCDIRDDDYTIDCDKIESLITDKTCAIVPVHVYGNICDVERLEEIAEKYGLYVIYDAAHAFGETYKGKNIANYGSMSMFSFHATKVFNTVEGGALSFSEDSWVQKFNGLKQFGQIVKTDEVPYVGTNAKMTEMHAAMGLCNLKHIDEYISDREKVVKLYRARLANHKGIKLCPVDENVKYNYAYFPVVFEEQETGVDRDMIQKELEKYNIYVRKYFYPITNDFEIIKQLGYYSETPIAKYISDRVLTLPCYSSLALEDVDKICDVILGLYED